MSEVKIKIEAIMDGFRVYDDGGDLEPSDFITYKETIDDVHNRALYYSDIGIEVIAHDEYGTIMNLQGEL